jgi:hypothetical protein
MMPVPAARESTSGWSVSISTPPLAHERWQLRVYFLVGGWSASATSSSAQTRRVVEGTPFASATHPLEVSFVERTRRRNANRQRKAARLAAAKPRVGSRRLDFLLALSF